MMKLLRKIVDRILGPYLDKYSKIQMRQIPAVNKGIQILLSLKYKELARTKAALPDFSDVELRSFSQNGEDGILLYIFSLIGATNKRCVELAAGNGIECMSANLIINHGWEGLLIDGDEKNIRTAKDFYEHSPDTFIFPPIIKQSWVTSENVNETVSDFAGEIDLLTLDLDGMDYWIWKALDIINPRVVVLEYHEEFGYEPVAVPYKQDFQKENKDSRYFGASLPAFVRLAKQKGYRLVGCNRQKFNAFFVQGSIGEDLLPEVSLQSCMRSKKPESYTLLKKLSDKPFEHV